MTRSFGVIAGLSCVLALTSVSLEAGIEIEAEGDGGLIDAIYKSAAKAKPIPVKHIPGKEAE